MNTEAITDYAMPLIQIERMTKVIHDLCLEHKYGEAREIMEEKEQHAYPKIIQPGAHPVQGASD